MTVWTSGDVTLYHGDCLDILPTLADGSVDAVVTDPPYGIGLAEWDTAPTDRHWAEMIRVAREFVASFAQAPAMFETAQILAKTGARYCEHIIWVKRAQTPSARLCRAYENILVYSVGDRRSFYDVKGPYEDVKLPGLLLGLTTVESIDRHIKDLRAKLNGNASPIQGGKRRQREFAYLGRVETDRSPERVNYTNVWSFLPPQHAVLDGMYRHPTEKPVPVLLRLAEMLTKDGGTVLDPFMGSGTTGVACVQTGRRFIGIELDEEYFEITKQRIIEAQMQPRLEGM